MPPPDDVLETLSSGGVTAPDGFRIDAHSHRMGMLVYPASGLLATITSHGTWVAPANRITWTPPGFEHAHRFYGPTDVRVVNLPPALCGDLADRPGVYIVSPLLREIVLTLTERPESRPRAHDRLRGVLIDELIEAPELSLHFPEPHDERLRAVTELLRAEPSQTSTLAELGRATGASERTLSRLFRDELGMSFQRWRTILRIHHALIHLDNGVTVTGTATRCGWSNTTSFIEAFTAVTGQTPGRYQAELRQQPRHRRSPRTAITPDPPDLEAWLKLAGQ